ncbi:MAG: DNA polymerase III subunit beta [Dysgonomonas sp.]|jgi:DNA polymerase-3 subunit beta|uniref:DNA polymerase III subunit beta n=1 Tax=unclassified Dysgonomonas TaxID=2630389 RepID=UPI0025C5AC17|nr:MULTISPECIES: DNA polymerase III subunit beta [unclassified Dysgonomonas]MDR1715717.1 DNA polymerase III subunit beta [Prevotella sp.]MDR2003138.1 DNA polymerase III subunit beta [Prevotella sp.]HMM04089.1 DNA polymerase III subunit beta [Dysgonomonas sp.]
MKFVVSSTALLSHLQAISKVINSKNTLPILDCFLLELEGSTLTLTAADAETRLVTSLEVNEADGNGKFAVNAKNLLDPLKELPEQPLTFEINNDNLETFIFFHNGKYNFIGQSGDDYPQPKELKDTAVSLTIEPQVLFAGINRTLFASADDELRPVMNGVFFDITPEDLTFVASDGHKLVRCKTLSAKGAERASFILPKKPANLLKAILPKEAETVEIKFDENNAYIKMSSYTMTCRFIEGRYPNYNSVIPQNNTNKVILDRQAFLNALKRVSVFSNQASNLIKLQLTDRNIIVTAQDIDFSTAAEETIACEYTGSPMNIGFKSSFLIEILNNIPSTDISLELSDPSRAGLIIPTENEENEDLLMLLMPMMLND